MTTDAIPSYLMPIVAQLRRRQIYVGIGDVQALRLALRAGFGLSSRDELRELCVALWAKSPVEAEVVRAAFARLDDLADWRLADAAGEAAPVSGQQVAAGGGRLAGAALEAAPVSGQQVAAGGGGGGEDGGGVPGESPPGTAGRDAATTGTVRNLGPGFDLNALRAGASGRGLVLVPQYPLTSREVAQAWRHLRRPVRWGPAVELDIDATIGERVRRGVATPPVLVPRRRNAVRLLMLIDRQGSMTPFHGYVDYVVAAIRDAGRIDHVQTAYFHDGPGSSQDRAALEEMADPFRPDLDDVLGKIGPLRGGRVYDDPDLTKPRALDGILSGVTLATAVLVISDAGAARRQFDITRLLDSVALIKALRAGSAGVAWLNPVPRDWWSRTTAGQMARYVPMFALNRPGLYQAVDVLRGRPVPVERPV